MVKVSVIVPVYNVENYLRRCLDSVINQTLEDIEIICINDGSTDSSLEILNEYSKIDDRIIVSSQENQGVSVARNHGIKIAKGEYFYFIDPDDWIELECLDKLYWHAVYNNSDIVLFNSIEHQKNNELRERIYLPTDEDIDYTNFVFDVHYNKSLLLNKFNVVWSILYKSSLIKDNNIKFPRLRMFEDAVFHVETLILAKRISYVPEFLHHYNRLNQNSLQNKTTKYNKRLALFEGIDKIEEILNKYGYYEEFKIRFFKFKIKQNMLNFKMINNEEFKEEFYNKLWKDFTKMKLNPSTLEKLPIELHQFYVYVINFKSYKIYKKFNRTKNLNYVNKPKLDEIISDFKEIGIDNDNPESVIVSLTSFPERMYDIHYCLYSLLTQELKPKKVILWLAEEQFPNKEEDIPQKVLKLKDNGLSIKWCNDIKAYKKLIPALKAYPNDYIVTADDDLFYPKNWLKEIWQTHKEYPGTIISSRTRQVSFDEEGNLNDYNDWELSTAKKEPSYLNFPTNGAGTLFYPNSLQKEVSNEELFLKLCPTADDIWFWTMAILNKTKITGVEKPYTQLCYVNMTRELNVLDEYTLWEVNKEGNNDIQLNNILNRFPEIKENLYEE